MAPPSKKLKKKHAKTSESQEGLSGFMDHEEYNSQIFKIQIEELLKEMDIEMIPDQWIEQLQDFIKNIHETSAHSMENFPLRFIELPMLINQSGQGMFKFIYPEKITLIGSFKLKTICSTTLPYKVDMAVEIPKACWQNMDFLNERYHRKRALYLAYIALALLEAEFVEELKFEYQNNCHLKPVLLITPKGISDRVVALTAYPSENAFKLTRFIPKRNNVRPSWKLGTSNSELEIPTPYYNATVLADMLLMKLNNYLNETVTHENIKNGIRLVKLWLIRRGLLSGHGRPSGFVVTMFVAYLLKKGKINCFMSPYQVFRCTLLALDYENLAEGISLASGNADQPTLADFELFPAIFLEESGFLNLLYSVNRETIDMIKYEAKLGLNLLKLESPNSFFLLFMKKVTPMEKFEFLVHMKGPKQFRKYSRKLCDTREKVDFGENKIAAVVPKICDMLRKGLRNRILFLDVIKSSPSPWSIRTNAPSPNCGQLTIGLLLNPDVPFSNIEKGPLADETEAIEFRSFWGTQSELRRFQDGSVRESVYWPGTTFADKRKVFIRMIKDILKRHLNRQEDMFVVNGCEIDVVLTLPKYVISPDFLYYGTGEEAHVAIMESFNSLSKDLRMLKELPLQVSSIRGISPAFHYSDVFPPLPISTPSNLTHIKSNSPDRIKKRILANLLFTPALNVIIELEGSGKWPNDVIGIRKLKTVFLIKISELVRSQYSLTTVAFVDHIDIVKDGFLFRLFIASHKELYLSKICTLPSGATKVRDTEYSRELDLKINIYPKLNNFLHGLQLQHFTFGTACRLAKRWMSALLLEGFFHSTTAELLMAHVYIHPEPLACPNSPQTGFIRFLSLILHHDWEMNPLVVNFNNELQKNDIEEIYTTFTDQRSMLPPMVIATPLDSRGTLWTKNKPTKFFLKRIVFLAGLCLKILEDNFSYSKDVSFKHIFRPSLKPLDLVIQLNQDAIMKAMCGVDAEFTAPLQPLKSYKKDSDRKYPNVEFDPPKLFFQQLQEIYGDFAYFLYDPYGGTFIGVIWKDSQLAQKEFKSSHFKCHVLKDGTLTGCKESILEDIKLLGKGIISDIVRPEEVY